MLKMDTDDQSSYFPIVGRADIDFSKYLVNIQGRDIIDYEKLKKDDVELYKKILQAEHETDARYDAEHEEF